MITPTKDWRGYPNAARITCDHCGATISEGTNPENAEERVPVTAILVRRTIFTPHGIRRDQRDYCGVYCQSLHGICEDETTDSAS